MGAKEKIQLSKKVLSALDSVLSEGISVDSTGKITQKIGNVLNSQLDYSPILNIRNSLENTISSVESLVTDSIANSIYETGQQRIDAEQNLEAVLNTKITEVSSIINDISNQLSNISTLKIADDFDAILSNISSTAQDTFNSIISEIPSISSDLLNTVTNIIETSLMPSNILSSLLSALIHRLNIPYMLLTLNELQPIAQNAIQVSIDNTIKSMTNVPIQNALSKLYKRIKLETVDPPNLEEIIETKLEVVKLSDIIKSVFYSLSSIVLDQIFTQIMQTERNENASPSAVDASSAAAAAAAAASPNPPTPEEETDAPLGFKWISNSEKDRNVAILLTSKTWIDSGSKCYILYTKDNNIEIREDASFVSFNQSVGNKFKFSYAGGYYGGMVSLYIGNHIVYLEDASKNYKGNNREVISI